MSRVFHSACWLSVCLSGLLVAATVNATPVFINEIHYDNSGSDLNEGFEIAGPVDTNLQGWQLVLYNGSNGLPYASIPLTGVIPDQADGFGVLPYLSTGVQNGAPDGVALVDNNNQVVQFLSYEGVINGTSGAADGLTSIDIGVEETTGTDVGTSLQLLGSGSLYADFQWAAGVAQSFGAINAGQVFTSVTADVPVPGTLWLCLLMLPLWRYGKSAGKELTTKHPDP